MSRNFIQVKVVRVPLENLDKKKLSKIFNQVYDELSKELNRNDWSDEDEKFCHSSALSEKTGEMIYTFSLKP